jgi:hypothetical protein
MFPPRFTSILVLMFLKLKHYTVLKWETALRKALVLVAREPDLVVDAPIICLQLAILNLGITDGDRKLITDALKTIGVKARFCGS